MKTKRILEIINRFCIKLQSNLINYSYFDKLMGQINIKVLTFLFFVFFLGISSCKKEESATDACAASSSELQIQVSPYGYVKHPIPEGIYFNEGQIFFEPFFSSLSQSVTFSNLSFVLDNAIDYQAYDSLPFWETQNLTLGEHTISVELDCDRQVFQPIEVNCVCQGNERMGSKTFEVIQATYIVFDSLKYNNAIGCNWDFPGDPCADLDFDFSYYDSDLVIPIESNYEGPATPFNYEMNDTIPIYPESCSLTLCLEDYDQIGNSEEIDTWTLDGSTMGDWNTGTYMLGNGLIIQITRL